MLDTKFFLNLKNRNYIKSFDLIKKAYDFSKSKHSGQYRDDGKDYFTHPIAVAEILSNMGLDSSTIITALLHDVVEDSAVTIQDIKKIFGLEISKLVDGVTKLTKIELKFGLAQAENFRKLLISSSDDIRVLLVKLADNGYKKTLLDDKNYLAGLNIYKGKITCKGVAQAFDFEYTPPEQAILE